MDFQKLVADLSKLVADAQPLVIDVEAIVADFEVAQGKLTVGERQANGQILAQLLALLKQFASNPVVQQMIIALITSLLGKVIPPVTPTT